MAADSARRWPSYLLDRACEPPPANCGVVPGTTPVVSFGDPVRPDVATLGINPSSGEFLARSGRLLEGDRRRLATLASLGIKAHADLDPALRAAIVDDCATYFLRRPYRWFTPLDRILRASLGVSYFNGTACHLDLVQWATAPVWRALDERARARLLDCDTGFLMRQLHNERYQVVLINGRMVLDWVERAGITRWRQVARLAGPPPVTVYVGDVASPRFIAWSCNLQSQPGAARHAARLAELVREHSDGGWRRDTSRTARDRPDPNADT